VRESWERGVGGEGRNVWLGKRDRIRYGGLGSGIR